MKTTEPKSTLATKPSTRAQRPAPVFGAETEAPFFSEATLSAGSPVITPAPPPPFFSSAAIQAKLTIGQPGDKYEQEADAMADRVVQRKCAACAAEEEGIAPKLQRKPIFESQVEDKVQRKCATCEAGERISPSLVQLSGQGDTGATPELESRLNATRGSGSPLPEETRTQMESSFDTDFSGVRVHTDNSSVQMNRELGAQAFTHGSDIYFNRGKYDPGSSGGQHLLAHELTHVVQQKGQNHIQRQPFSSTFTFRKRLMARWFKLDSGQSLKLTINAKRNPEGCSMPDTFIVYLYNVAEKRYETSVSFPTTGTGAYSYVWKGLAGGAYQFILLFKEQVAEGCSLTGTLETQHESALDNIVPTARTKIGSSVWAYDANRPPYGPNTNKCNLFVYEALNEAGASVQMIKRTRFGISRGEHPPLAGQWGDPGFSIPGWQVVSSPQPGDVVAEAHQYSDASGHVGIVTSVSSDGKMGTTVSATADSVVENDWGFRSGQNPVFRRYGGR